MWPLGHLAVAYLSSQGYSQWLRGQHPGEAAVGATLVGAVLPDLIDKPLSWYIGVLPTGRSLGHSLVFVLPFVVVVWLFCRRRGRTDLAIGLLIGMLSHQFADLFPMVWGADTSVNMLLWPILAVDPYPGGAPTVLGLLSGQLTSPYFLLEFVLAGVAILIWRHNRVRAGGSDADSVPASP